MIGRQAAGVNKVFGTVILIALAGVAILLVSCASGTKTATEISGEPVAETVKTAEGKTATGEAKLQAIDIKRKGAS